MKISWSIIFYQVAIPVFVLVIGGYVIPLVRSAAKSQENNLKKQRLDALANILDVLIRIAKAQVIQTEANKTVGTTGVDKKQVAIQSTKIQAQKLGVDTKNVDLAAIVETAFSAKKQELHANYRERTKTTQNSNAFAATPNRGVKR